MNQALGTKENPYDISNLGMGVKGCATLRSIFRYTNEVINVFSAERKEGPGLLNSNESQNSQTLHVGDIESNYDKAKVESTFPKSQATRIFAEEQAAKGNVFHSVGPQMIVGTTPKEREIILDRFDMLQGTKLFPKIRLIDTNEMYEVEPELMRGRDVKKSPIIGIRNEDGVRIDFGKLAESLLEDAKNEANKEEKGTLDVKFNTSILDIKRHSTTGDLFEIILDNGTSVFSKAVMVNLGSYSEVFNEKLGYNKAKGVVSIAANYIKIDPDFFETPLKAKIYGIQKEGVPYARAHLDGEWDDPNNVRLGPTALPVYYLENDKRGSFLDFLKLFKMRDIKTYINLLKDPNYVNHMRNNLLYKIPHYGKKRFLRNEAQSLLPLLTMKYLKNYVQGGMRAITTDSVTHTMNFGGGRVFGKDPQGNIEGICTNAAASPGASTSVYDGADDTNIAYDTFPGLQNFSLNKELMEKDGIFLK